jgi:hypothetical protein
MNRDLFGLLSEEIDDSPDQGWANIPPLKNFLVLIQDLFCYQPNETFSVSSAEKYISARILGRNVGSLETRNAGH